MENVVQGGDSITALSFLELRRYVTHSTTWLKAVYIPRIFQCLEGDHTQNPSLRAAERSG